MELMWGYIFKECLKVDPSGMKIVVTEPTMNPKSVRKFIIETLFDKFCLSGINFSSQVMTFHSFSSQKTLYAYPPSNSYSSTPPLFQQLTPLSLSHQNPPHVDPKLPSIRAFHSDMPLFSN
eukprot:GHVL01012310.1.p1 GENE.GHVL01012310.1~~GHVL01012310.1.p1  ORF type:complete len:121 (-),score=13.64 GHVL01012310.1:114-476(-)